MHTGNGAAAAATDAAVASIAHGTVAPASSGSVYSMHGLTLPLPAPLCARIQARLDARSAAAHADGGASDTGAAVAAAPTGPSRSDGAAPSAFALRCDWRIHVNDPTGKHAGAAPASHSYGDAGAPAATPSPSAPLCLATLARSLAFVTNAYPFAGAQETLDGLARVVALMPSFSAASRAPSEPMPQVTWASVRGQLLRMPDANGSATPPMIPSAAALQSAPVVLEASAERRADECAMLGQDTLNAWGDVDILLEEPPPSAGGSTAAGSAAAAAPAATIVDGVAAPSAGLYCLNILPGSHIPLHVHRGLVESEFMLSGSSAGHGATQADSAVEQPPAALMCQGEAVRVGDVHRWQQEQAHLYENRSSTLVQRILCVNIPRFERALEIEVPHTPDLVLCRPPRDNTESLALWRGVMAAGSSFTFPGGLPTQRVTLRTDPSTFVQPHAVLVFVFAHDDAPQGDATTGAPSTDAPPAAAAAAPSSSHATPRNPALLFVRHRVRGWELPGGKVDAGETGLAAAIREVDEESCVRLCDAEGAPRLLAQYSIQEEGQSTHVKSVFVARARRTQGAGDGREALLPQQETDAARFVRPPPEWTRMFAKTDGQPSAMSFSSILNDNVYPICLQLALASLPAPTTIDSDAAGDLARTSPL